MKYSHNTLRDIASVLCLFPSGEFIAEGKNNFRISNSEADLTIKSAAVLYFTSVFHFQRLITKKADSLLDAENALYNQVIYRLINAAAKEKPCNQMYITESISYNPPCLYNSCSRMTFTRQLFVAKKFIKKIWLVRSFIAQGTFLPCY